MNIMKHICFLVMIGLASGVLTGCVTEKDKEAKLESEAKITRTQAEKIVLAKVPGGTIKSGEIEKEKGKLIWSFDLSTPDTKDITEVNVDAMTGEILAVEKETASAAEKEGK